MRRRETRRTSSSTVMSYVSKSTLRRFSWSCARCPAASTVATRVTYRAPARSMIRIRNEGADRSYPGHTVTIRSCRRPSPDAPSGRAAAMSSGRGGRS